MPLAHWATENCRRRSRCPYLQDNSQFFPPTTVFFTDEHNIIVSSQLTVQCSKTINIPFAAKGISNSYYNTVITSCPCPLVTHGLVTTHDIKSCLQRKSTPATESQSDHVFTTAYSRFATPACFLFHYSFSGCHTVRKTVFTRRDTMAC